MQPASAPSWLLPLVSKSEQRQPTSPGAAPKQRKSNQNRRYGQAALDGELRRVRSAPLHQRNNSLNVSAFRTGQLVGAGYIDEADAIQQLMQAATQIGLARGEIPKTIRSGIEAGKRFPRRKSPRREKPVTKRADGSAGDPITAALAQLGGTDADNAERFVKRHGSRFAYCPELGWLHFDGKRWTPDTARKRTLAAMKTARRIADESAHLSDKTDQQQRAAHGKHSLSKAALDRMLDLAVSGDR